MSSPNALSRDLAQLTEALDRPGTDLQAVLAVLADDLRVSVPSFLGLVMTVAVDGNPVTLTAIEAIGTASPAASMQLPLNVFGAGRAVGSVLFYAANPGAFVDLGADSQRVFHPGSQVVIDGHLATTPDRSGVIGLCESTIVNRGIGALIEQGHPPDAAQDELLRIAAAAQIPVAAAAELLLGALGPPPDANHSAQ